MFKRRLGVDVHASGGQTSGANACPDIWEMDDGTIAVIGIRKTSVLKSMLPTGVSCGLDEEIVILPRNVLLGAKDDIANLE